jgi:hypothetical protein
VLVERVRAALRARIQAALTGRAYAGVIVALVIGDQRGIDHGGVHESSALKSSIKSMAYRISENLLYT